METIASFTVDHLKLLPGVYVSRKDCTGTDIVTTFDIRMTRPNFEPVMNTAEIHAVEHLGATFLRNHDTMGEKVVYFGPMGCPHRLLPDSCRRLRICGYRAFAQRNVCIYQRIRRGDSGSSAGSLWQLPGSESADGKICCQAVSYRSTGKYYQRALKLSIGILFEKHAYARRKGMRKWDRCCNGKEELWTIPMCSF